MLPRMKPRIEITRTGTIGEHFASLTTDKDRRAYLLKMKMQVIAQPPRDGGNTIIMLHGVHTQCRTPECPECAEAKEIMEGQGSMFKQLCDRPYLLVGMDRPTFEDMLCVGAGLEDSEKARNLAHFFSNLVEGLKGESTACTFCTA